LKAPIAHTSRAKEFVEPDNPFNVGMTGILGNRAGLEAIDQADMVLCLGTDFAWTQYYPPKAQIAQVDIDPLHLGRRSPVHLGLVGDIAATAAAVLPMVDARSRGDHLDRALRNWEQDQAGYEAAAKEPDPALIHPQFVAQRLSAQASDDAIFTADGGSPQVWCLRHVEATSSRRFLISLLHGTMANAYPQALGIAAAFPYRQVIALCGDGGMTMLMGDLLTLRQEQLPVKLLVFNNGSLGFVEMEQRVEGLLDSFTRLDNPDFAAVARACGLYGRRVESADALDSAMQEWLAHNGPALLDVTVSRMELVMPPRTELKQIGSTALFGIKAVLDGRLKEVASLLRDNFLR
jgi:pyruvate dehydrogenase (quinone)